MYQPEHRRRSMNSHTAAIGLGTILLGLFVPAGAFAQKGGVPGSASGGWGSGSGYDRLFDSSTVETLAGRVASVGYYTPKGFSDRGVHVVLETGTVATPVHLGPAWYVEKQDMQLAAGDRIEVTGSRIEYEGGPAIVATLVLKGADSLELRNAQGFPRWAGWRRTWMGAGPGDGRGDGAGWGRGADRGGAWWEPGSAYQRLYDPKTVEEIAGKVVRAESFTPRNAIGRGLHLLLETEKETVPVHLGPEWFVANQTLEVRPGDNVVVKGSRIMYEGEPAIVAATIRKGDDVLELRDEQGLPRWAAWRRGVKLQ
jgi:hypothetical protein